MSSCSKILGSDAATIRPLLFEMESRVVEKGLFTESGVSQRLPVLNEIVESRTKGSSSNENTCFSSAAVHGDCTKSISAADNIKEMNCPIK